MTILLCNLWYTDVDENDGDDGSVGLSMESILRRHARGCSPRLWPSIMMHIRHKPSSCLSRSLPQWMITHLVKGNVSTRVVK